MHNNQQVDSALPLKSAIFGAVVTAAALMLSRKEVRDNILKGAKKLLDAGEKRLDDVIHQAEETKTDIAKRVEKTARSLQ